MTCSKALGALGLISVRGLDHPLTGNTFLCAKVDNIYKVTVIRDEIRNSSVVSIWFCICAVMMCCKKELQL